MIIVKEIISPEKTRFTVEVEDTVIEEMRLRGLDFWKEITAAIQKDKNEN